MQRNEDSVCMVVGPLSSLSQSTYWRYNTVIIAYIICSGIARGGARGARA